jgi:hypothetical protein
VGMCERSMESPSSVCVQWGLNYRDTTTFVADTPLI